MGTSLEDVDFVVRAMVETANRLDKATLWLVFSLLILTVGRIQVVLRESQEP